MLSVLKKPLIHGFRGTTITKAFILNAFSSALIAVMAYESKKYYGRVYLDKTNNELIFLSFITTFITALFAFFLMRILFGYGGGMLAGPLK